jgi:hypothetical protein
MVILLEIALYCDKIPSNNRNEGDILIRIYLENILDERDMK